MKLNWSAAGKKDNWKEWAKNTVLDFPLFWSARGISLHRKAEETVQISDAMMDSIYNAKEELSECYDRYRDLRTSREGWKLAAEKAKTRNTELADALQVEKETLKLCQRLHNDECDTLRKKLNDPLYQYAGGRVPRTAIESRNKRIDRLTALLTKAGEVINVNPPWGEDYKRLEEELDRQREQISLDQQATSDEYQKDTMTSVGRMQ